MSLRISVPATTANLGPGFDCLGLALSLRNHVEVSRAGRTQVVVEGEGAGILPQGDENLVLRAMRHLATYAGRSLPPVRLVQHNDIPVGSGLGSSASAVIAGLLAGGALLDIELPPPLVLALAAELEGHADNAAAALYGGLVLVAGEDVVQLNVAPLRAVVVLPAVTLSTQAARAALPQRVPLADAVFNLGRMGLLLQALASGDVPALSRAMADRLHQPYRTPLIPGLDAALAAASAAGAAACLSGAGPSLIAFATSGHEELAAEMMAAFAHDGVASRNWTVRSDHQGAELTTA
ncbi:MAG: homoserine kinase [Anaerolineae bacterium]|nr:homoserine kinase [Anaerolineae bacterium]